MSLEKLIDQEVEKLELKTKKVLVTSDYHVPYLDKRAYKIMKSFAKDYKPDIFIINGDLVDFYRLSRFDKNPDRKTTVSDEIHLAREYLEDLRKALGKKTKIYFVGGNHEQRLQRYLWNNPELADLDELRIDNLLHLKELKIKYVPVDGDYWSQDNGHLVLGNVLITHGDNRLNGASISKYSGYSIKNTILGGTQMNTIIGHCHRLNHFFHTTPYGTLQGLEGGCLCQKTGTANWQQGFVTFELHKGKMVNPKLYYIFDGTMYADGKTYKYKK